MKKIGVIGATGMLGHHVAREVIAQGNELYVIHRAKSKLARISDLNYKARVASLNDSESLIYACEGLDYVINCGAYYPIKPEPLKKELKIARRQINHFIKAIKKSGVKKALYVGAAIAIPQASDGIADETLVYDEPPADKAAYIQVKWLMDKLVRDAGQGGVPVVIGIPGMTFGEYDYGPSTGRLIVNAANETLPGYVEGHRNLVYAGDAAKGLLAACLEGTPGERYLITGENISIGQIIGQVLEQMEIKTSPPVVPLFKARLKCRYNMLKYRLFGGDLPLLDDTALAVMSSGQYLNGEKAKNFLGYQAQVSSKQTIARTIQWFKEVGYIKR